MQWETEGLREAMKALRIKEGVVVTFGQEDRLDGIPVVPAWKWFSRRPKASARQQSL